MPRSHDGRSGARLKVVALVRMFGVSGGGGAERLARELLVGLDPDRFERILCVSRPPPRDNRIGKRIAADLRERGVRVEFLNRRFKYGPLAWWPLFRLLRRERVDILHAHAFGQNAWGTVLGRLARVPVVIAHEHNWAFTGRALRPIVDRHVIARWSDAIVVVSREAHRRMIEVERVPPEKLILLRNGIRALRTGDGAAVRSELGIPVGDPVIGTVCVIRAEKALDVLVRSAALVMQRIPQLRVVIAGDGPDRAAVEAVVREHGCDDSVLMLGARSDVPDILAALDVAVLCSHFEGMPLALLEFMDAGRPIVATRVGAVPDSIEDGVHGLLVEPRDEPALARAIIDLLRDPKRAGEMGARARERRRREFDLQGTIDRLQELYERRHAERSRPHFRVTPARDGS